MATREGGISIFLAIVFLSLIVFVMSIVEVTRYQILRGQAERMVISATQSVLAGYDSALKDQYGIFARNPDYSDAAFIGVPLSESSGSGMAQDFGYYLMTNTQQSIADVDRSLVDRYVLGYDEDIYWNTAPLYPVEREMIPTTTLGDKDGKGLHYVKQDMMTYMTYRLPLVGMTEILETFEAAEKLGKTTELIDGKNQQLEKAASLEELYTQLYWYLDGVDPDVDAYSFIVEDIPYVNRVKTSQDSFMIPYEGLGLSIEVPEPYEPIKAIQGLDRAYNRIVGSVDGLGGLTRALTSLQDQQLSIIDRIKDLKKDLKDLEATYERVEQSLAEAKNLLAMPKEGETADYTDIIVKLESRLAEIAEAILLVEQELKDEEQDKASIEKRIETTSQAILSKMTSFREGYHLADQHFQTVILLAYGDNSVLAMNENAAETIHKIVVEGEAIEKGINGFLGQASTEQDAYMSSAYDQTVKEMEALKDSYGSGSETTAQLIGNLTRIGEVLESNINLLKPVEGNVLSVAESFDSSVVTLLIEEGLNRGDLIELTELSASRDVYDRHFRLQTWSPGEEDPQALFGHFEAIEQALPGYRIVPLLDYSGFSQTAEAKEERQMFRGVVNQMKGLLEDLNPQEALKRYDPADLELPESGFTALMASAVKLEQLSLDTTYNEDDYQGKGSQDDDGTYMSMGGISSGMTNLVTDAKESLLIGEYAIGMFRSFPDSHRQQPETLAGYRKQDRNCETELEYIYTGLTDSDAALRQVATRIFALRTAFNLVHLSTNGTKRAYIMKAAAAIAGPVSAGILTFVVAAFITLLWATIESFADLDQLLTGKKVPLLKTSSSWTTGPGKLVDLTMDRVTEIAVGYSEQAMDALSDQAKTILEGVKGHVSAEGEALVEEQAQQLAQQMDSLVHGAVDEFDQVLHEAIDDAMTTQSGLKRPVAADYLQSGSPGYALLDYALHEMNQAWEESADEGYVVLLKKKNEIMDDLQAEYEQVKLEIQDRVKAGLKDTIDKCFKEMEEEVDQLAEKGKEVSSDYLSRKLSGYREQLTESSKGMGKGIQPQKAKMDYSLLIPAIDYEMYVRIFMFADSQGQEARVMRMLHLIDYELAAQKGQATAPGGMTLSDYACGVQGYSEIQVPYFFLNLPVPAFKERMGDTYYTIKVAAVNSYD